MSDTSDNSDDTFTVIEPMNAHDTVTVRSATTHATHHLVAYADESTRRALSSLDPGESVRAAISRLGGRGNGFRAEAATPRPAESATGGRPASD